MKVYRKFNQIINVFSCIGCIFITVCLIEESFFGAIGWFMLGIMFIVVEGHIQRELMEDKKEFVREFKEKEK